MKINVETKETIFEPIELTITIESKEELETLWHRFNISKKGVERETDPIGDVDRIVLVDTYDVFCKLDALLSERGVTK